MEGYGSGTIGKSEVFGMFTSKKPANSPDESLL
jgi:hypothetical protein